MNIQQANLTDMKVSKKNRVSRKLKLGGLATLVAAAFILGHTTYPGITNVGNAIGRGYLAATGKQMVISPTAMQETIQQHETAAYEQGTKEATSDANIKNIVQSSVQYNATTGRVQSSFLNQ